MIRWVDPNVLAVLLPLGMVCYFVPSLTAISARPSQHGGHICTKPSRRLDGIGWIGVLIWSKHKPQY
jgi:hypothetical protein